MQAYTGGPMLVANYGVPVVIDLAGLKAKAPIPILLDHDTRQIVGHAEEIDVQATGVQIKGLVSGGGQASEQVQAAATNGFPWKASVGVVPEKLEFVGEDIKTQVNGKTLTGPLYVARKSSLRETSFVAIAADDRTSVKVAASAAHSTKETDMDFTTWIEAMGLVEAELRDDQIAKLKEKYQAEIKAAGKPKDGTPPPIEAAKFDVSAIELAAAKHLANVEAKAAAFSGKVADAKHSEILASGRVKSAELKAKALNEEWPSPRLEVELVKAAADVEVALIRAERPAGPGIHASSQDTEPQVIQAALAITAGIREPEKHFKPEVLEAAGKLRNLGLQEMLLMQASANGYHGRQSISDANLRDVLKAAFSTHTVTTMLTQLGNKFLLEGFLLQEQTWRQVADVKTVSDFKAMTAFRLNSDLEYEEVGPAGEIKHGSMSQESYSYQAKTYARMAALTRQDIINDDLNAFSDIRRHLGLGAVLKMNKLFWTAWLTARNGAAFWTSTRKNLVTSAALGEAGLTAAVLAFRTMPNPNGGFLGFTPTAIVVPPQLEATADKIYESGEIRDTTANTKTFTTNIYQRRFPAIVVNEMGDSSYTGYSATSWHMITNPAVLASATMAFLNGQQSPTIESADADFNVLGIQFRGYHDFGVAMTEYRASLECQA